MMMRQRLRDLIVLAVGVALATLIAAPAHAQQEITGTVTDGETGETLPGANVSVPGTQVGTATNMDGAYSLSVPETADSLRFSFVGYVERTVSINGRSTIDVTLQASRQQLQELVVVGYGEQQERDVTGVVNKVSSADFNPVQSATPEQLISGKISGVQISSSSGAPGAGSFIRIRGATSVNADSRPLFVVDGVPLSNDGNTAQNNPLSFLNPSDIESVTVLKDASSAAIYGARGANGVILIETKQADEGEGRVTYNGTISSAQIQDEIDVLDANQFRQVVQEQAPSVADELGFANTDWQDLVQRDGYTQEHNLAFSRGYEDSDFRLSLGYRDEQGVLENSGLERISASLNYNVRLLDDDLALRSSFKGSKTTQDFEPGGLVGGAAAFDPTQPVRDVRSDFGGFYEWPAELPEDNPVASYVLEENIGETYRSIGSVEAEYSIPMVTGLSARANLGYDVSTGEREFFAPTFLKAQAENDFPGEVTRANFRQLNTLLDAYLTYDRTFDEIESKFDVTAGYSWQEINEEYPEYTAAGLSTNIYGSNRSDVIRADSLSQVTTSLSEIPSRLISGFARLNYTFQDKYLLTATVRRDGSSKFGPENRWGTFPSGALAWRIHQEEFMEAVPQISSLKLRLSAGITGNQEIGDFEYAPFYTTGGSQAQAQFGNEFVTTIRPAAADQSLKWEETTSYNIGLDYGLFDGRVSGAIEFYRKDTDDLLFTVTAPGGANLSNQVLTNIGEMRNQGVEFSISGDAVRTEDFSWNVNLNASTNNNELLQIDLPGAQEAGFQGELTGGISGGFGNNIQVLQEGEPVNSFFTYEHKLDDNGDPLVDGVDHNGDGNVNDLDMYVDRNGDGEINTQDRYVSGNPQPDWILGHTSQFRYRNFDLSFTLRAHLGQQVYNNVESNFGHYSRIESNQIPTNIHESALETGFDAPQYFSDVYVEDASFLRMDNITLGYTVRSIPQVDRIRIFGQVSNAFILTGYGGTDPEVYSEGQGIDNNVYPRSRTFTAGLNVQL